MPNRTRYICTQAVQTLMLSEGQALAFTGFLNPVQGPKQRRTSSRADRGRPRGWLLSTSPDSIHAFEIQVPGIGTCSLSAR